MKKQVKKTAVLGAVLMAAAAMAGCYGYGYGNYSSRMNQVPKTTAAKDTLDEFDIASLQREDGTFQFGDLAWGSGQQEVEEALGAQIKETVAFTDGGGYGDLNYSIKLLDKVSLGLMPIFDKEDGLSCMTFYFENVYTAEQLDSFYTDLVALCISHFGEPDEVKPEERESNGTKFTCETNFWYHEVSPTQMTTLQVAKTDTGKGTDAVILGVNTYNPEEETSEAVSGEETEQEESSEAVSGSEEEETERSGEIETEE